MLGLELTEFSCAARRFAEAGVTVGPATIGDQQGRYRMPAMGAHEGRRAVVTRHDHDVWRQLVDSRDHGVQLLDPFHLAIEIAVLARTVGVFEICLLYTSPSPRDQRGSRMPSSA